MNDATQDQLRNAAIAENIKALRMMAHDIAQAADEAAQCMASGNRNGAIGTLSRISQAADTVGPVMKTIQSLHCLPKSESNF